jgi:hypothetical protein
VEEDETRDPLLEKLWQRVLEDWDNDKVHSALLEHAVRTHALPEIAGRYRALSDDPAKTELAQKRINAILLAATEMLMSMKTPPRAVTKVPLPITLTAVAICVTLLGWLALALWGRR